MATAEKTWRTKKTIQELASLLRDSGESREKLSQKTSSCRTQLQLVDVVTCEGVYNFKLKSSC